MGLFPFNWTYVSRFWKRHGAIDQGLCPDVPEVTYIFILFVPFLRPGHHAYCEMSSFLYPFLLSFFLRATFECRGSFPVILDICHAVGLLMIIKFSPGRGMRFGVWGIYYWAWGMGNVPKSDGVRGKEVRGNRFGVQTYRNNHLCPTVNQPLQVCCQKDGLGPVMVSEAHSAPSEALLAGLPCCFCGPLSLW